MPATSVGMPWRRVGQRGLAAPRSPPPPRPRRQLRRPEAGDPIQYDELRIEHDQGDVEIVVYNRAILLFCCSGPTTRRSDGFTRCAAGLMILPYDTAGLSTVHHRRSCLPRRLRYCHVAVGSGARGRGHPRPRRRGRRPVDHCGGADHGGLHRRGVRLSLAPRRLQLQPTCGLTDACSRPACGRLTERRVGCECTSRLRPTGSAGGLLMRPLVRGTVRSGEL